MEISLCLDARALRPQEKFFLCFLPPTTPPPSWLIIFIWTCFGPIFCQFYNSHYFVLLLWTIFGFNFMSLPHFFAIFLFLVITSFQHLFVYMHIWTSHNYITWFLMINSYLFSTNLTSLIINSFGINNAIHFQPTLELFFVWHKWTSEA